MRKINCVQNTPVSGLFLSYKSVSYFCISLITLKLLVFKEKKEIDGKMTHWLCDTDFAFIDVNCGNNLPNVRRDDETWKVRLIEENFLWLMFENNCGV
jgi:hypothetical protein